MFLKCLSKTLLAKGFRPCSLTKMSWGALWQLQLQELEAATGKLSLSPSLSKADKSNVILDLVLELFSFCGVLLMTYLGIHAGVRLTSNDKDDLRNADAIGSTDDNEPSLTTDNQQQM